MLQTNLIFGIQKKIKEGSKKEADTGLGMLEESTVIEKDNSKDNSKDELILEASFVAGIHTQVEKAKKIVQDQKVLITESFKMHKAQKKLEKDISYFNFLYENFVDPVFEDQYKELLESIFEDTITLYREADVTPRFVSQALDTNELNENQIVDIYKNRLNETIKNNYTKPLLSGKISELYESEIRDLTRLLITEGSDISMEQVQVYYPFEETMYNFNRSILIPEHAESRLNLFIESNTEEYLSFVEESAEEMLHALEKKIKLLTSMISPNMFDKAVDADGIDAPKMAGISITVDKNFNDDDCEMGEGCGMGAIVGDPEAEEEMRDEDEALDMDDAGGDVTEIEAGVREGQGLANDSEDYEDEAKQDRIAELSPAQATVENPNEPAATEIEAGMDMEISQMDAEGNSENNGDTALQGEGNDHGVLGNDEGNLEAVEDLGEVAGDDTVDADFGAGDGIDIVKVTTLDNEVSSDDEEDLEGSEEEVSQGEDEVQVGEDVDSDDEEDIDKDLEESGIAPSSAFSSNSSSKNVAAKVKGPDNRAAKASPKRKVVQSGKTSKDTVKSAPAPSTQKHSSTSKNKQVKSHNMKKVASSQDGVSDSKRKAPAELSMNSGGEGEGQSAPAEGAAAANA